MYIAELCKVMACAVYSQRYYDTRIYAVMHCRVKNSWVFMTYRSNNSRIKILISRYMSFHTQLQGGPKTAHLLFLNKLCFSVCQ